MILRSGSNVHKFCDELFSFFKLVNLKQPSRIRDYYFQRRLQMLQRVGWYFFFYFILIK